MGEQNGVRYVYSIRHAPEGLDYVRITEDDPRFDDYLKPERTRDRSENYSLNFERED